MKSVCVGVALGVCLAIAAPAKAQTTAVNILPCGPRFVDGTTIEPGGFYKELPKSLGGEAPPKILVGFDDINGFVAPTVRGGLASFAMVPCSDVQSFKATPTLREWAHRQPDIQIRYLQKKDYFQSSGEPVEPPSPPTMTVEIGPVFPSAATAGVTVVPCEGPLKLFGLNCIRTAIEQGKDLWVAPRRLFVIGSPVDQAGAPLTDVLTIKVAIQKGAVWQSIDVQLKPTSDDRFQVEAPSEDVSGRKRYSVIVDDVGVTSWRFLNKRNPPRIQAASGNEVEFTNRSAIRTILVHLAVPALGQGFLTPKVVKNGGGAIRQETCGLEVCDLVITLHPGESQRVPAELLAPKNAASSPPVAFRVSFFLDDSTPTNSVGYLATVDRAFLTEPDLKTAFSLSSSVGFLDEPKFADVVSDAAPYDDKRLSHWPVATKLSLKQSLGFRAEADVDLQIKSGDFGGADTVKDVRATKYQFTTYSARGYRLSFGKFLQAAPAGGIAIRESGEGLVVGFKGLTVGRLYKRESHDGSANPDDADSSSWITQASGLTFKSFKRIRSLDLIFVHGKDRQPGTAHQYMTGGATVNFSITPEVSGMMSVFRSDRRALGESTVKPGGGYVWLANGTYARVVSDGNAKWLVNGALGYGQKDNPDTDRDESYIGETSAFAPDSLFLSGLASKLPVVKTGLVGKKYIGGSVTYDGWSIFDLVADILQLPDDEIISHSMALSVHRYALSRKIDFESSLATEWGLEFQIETPKSVRVSSKLAYLTDGRVLRKSFPNGGAWSLTATTSITFK
jgi:hypothetical protein